MSCCSAGQLTLGGLQGAMQLSGRAGHYRDAVAASLQGPGWAGTTASSRQLVTGRPQGTQLQHGGHKSKNRPWAHHSITDHNPTTQNHIGTTCVAHDPVRTPPKKRSGLLQSLLLTHLAAADRLNGIQQRQQLPGSTVGL